MGSFSINNKNYTFNTIVAVIPEFLLNGLLVVLEFEVGFNLLKKIMF